MPLSRCVTTLIVLVLASVWMTGCLTTPGFALPGSPPSDFVLAATVFTPAGAHPEAPSSVPARYILEPDATLRAAIGPGSSPTTYPRPTRTLGSEQFNRLWNLARQLPLDTNDTREIESPENFSPPGDTGAILIELRANESQQAYAFRGDNPQVRALIDALAELAWVQAD